MGTFGNISQTGGPRRWQVSGQNITNHEVFAFTMERQPIPPGGEPERNVGALISDVTVYLVQDPLPPNKTVGSPSYNITLTAVDQFANPVDQLIGGTFRKQRRIRKSND
jgi:hypothetical protein